VIEVVHVCLAMKPVEGSFAENALRHGVAGLDVDGCRIGTETVRINTWDEGAKPFGGGAGTPYSGRDQQGRWPANLVHDGSVEVAGLMPESRSTGGSGERSTGALGKRTYGKFALNVRASHLGGLGDSGSAARFFQTCEPDPC
jgi:site-specific DNA-methyltransferase (adenine-specific)